MMTRNIPAALALAGLLLAGCSGDAGRSRNVKPDADKDAKKKVATVGYWATWPAAKTASSLRSC